MRFGEKYSSKEQRGEQRTSEIDLSAANLQEDEINSFRRLRDRNTSLASVSFTQHSPFLAVNSQNMKMFET